ncbi:protein-disulfide reductase DsbD family protein [Flavobacterium sp.]|uniref:protein-disulfide reductase DsbD family protein n=1 Tax=Flavobacterium sp. TaxID=239 RepID=UPI002B4B6C51|nr:cytochrome c biogenesis protein CcdA [Flavobacterium sp.]HLP64651.1 cytochrome c biogenesis protein CcdA [Flavobacterium sp.]
MRKLIFSLFAFLVLTTVNAQVLDPVKWKTRVEKKSDTELVLIMDAKIDNGWHFYSQYTPDGGALPAVFTFKDSKGNYQLVGKTTEGKYEKHYNDVFEVDEYFFTKSAQFKQTIKVLNPKLKTIKAELDGQTCIDGKCIQEFEAFTFTLPEIKVEEAAIGEDTTTVAPTTVDTIKNTIETVKTETTSTESTEPVKKEEKGFWTIFLLSFFGGLLATFTPCVFPMIPMTVSFFLKQSANKSKGKFNALFYGLCIVLICLFFTLPFHLLEGVNRDIFSEISTNVYLNTFFFIIFVTFAISFFGAFEITMPSKLSNKVDNASNSGGLLGIFFMALTLIIVSFSCIGPALGFVFGTSLNSDGGASILSMAMLGFGLGLALPFMFFALAPSLLGNLPKSGGWLNTVKVVFGFIELALAFKFLSNADIGMDLHWLEREVFIAFWIAIFGALSLYLFGKITLPHDSPMSHISVGRMLLGLVSLTFTVYLIPGLWGAPLKLISAFPPPMTYSESPQGFGKSITTTTNESLPKGAVYTVHNLVSFEDYEEGLAYAKEVNKPILIDFTGKQCVNCRLMENNVWSDPKVLEILKKDVVLISLYGDDKKELPKDEWYISKENGKEVNTVGEKWSEFQIQKYNNNARPYYVLLDPKDDKNTLNTPVPYTPDIEEYKAWLLDGISKFK